MKSRNGMDIIKSDHTVKLVKFNFLAHKINAFNFGLKFGNRFSCLFIHIDSYAI